MSAIGLGLVVVVAGCGGTATNTGAEPGGASNRLRVIATTTPVADFARQVGGDRVQVTGLLRPNVDPHDYEPSPADVATLGRAQVVVENGLGLEAWLDDAISSSGYSGPIVDTSRGIAVRGSAGGGHEGETEAEHAEEGHDDGGSDPHIWQNPQNAKTMVTAVRDAFIAADPDDAQAYRGNTDAYLGRLDALDAEVRRQIDTIPAQNRKVVTDHDALGYYFDRYGLTFVGSVIPSFDTSAELSGNQLADLVARIRAERVPAVFAQGSLPPQTAETVASEAGVEVVAGDGALYGDTLGPEGSSGDTYVRMVEHNTAAIVAALK